MHTQTIHTYPIKGVVKMIAALLVITLTFPNLFDAPGTNRRQTVRIRA